MVNDGYGFTRSEGCYNPPWCSLPGVYKSRSSAGVGGLFLTALLSQGGAISNGTATAILAGACVVVLAGILLVARRARASRRSGSHRDAPAAWFAPPVLWWQSS